MRSIDTLTLWLKKRFFSWEFIRFLVVGGINTGGGYVIYLLLLNWLGYRSAYTISFMVGVLISYALNAKFVFKQRFSLKALLRFPLVYAVQYLSGLVLLYLLIEQLGMPPPYAPIFVVVFNIPLTFLLSRYVINPVDRQ